METITREDLNAFKKDLLQTVKAEITLKVREEVENSIVTKVTQHMDDNTDRIISAIDVGNHQTHNLLSNIAGIMGRMEQNLASLNQGQNRLIEGQAQLVEGQTQLVEGQRQMVEGQNRLIELIERNQEANNQ